MLHVPVDLFMYPPSSPTPLVAQRRRLYLPAVEGAWISYGDLPYTGYGDHRVRQTVQRTRKQAPPTPPAKIYRFDARLNEEQKLLIQKAADLAQQNQYRARPDPGDDDPGKTFEDRAVRLETTFGGAGVLSGDLTPECTALVGTVLEALSAPRGAEDTRSHEQRYHDALEEAMRSR